MAAEGAIVGGLAVISALLGYFAFNLNESQNDINKKIGLLLAFMSLVFLNLVMFSVRAIAVNNASYLVDGILSTGLLVMIWLTIILMCFLGAGLMWTIIKTIKMLFDTAMGKRTREDNNE